MVLGWPIHWIDFFGFYTEEKNRGRWLGFLLFTQL